MSLFRNLKKQQSLSDVVDDVRTAYRDSVRAMSQVPTESYSGWVDEVYDDHVIACDDGEYWSVPYSKDDAGNVTFDFPSATEVERVWQPVAKTIVIEKTDDDRQLAFGWAYVYEKDGERVLDHSGEFIEKEDLEDAAYVFNLEFREGDERHGDEVAAHLVESFVVTPEKLEKMGVETDAVPHGWWTGWYVPDVEVFAKIKDGEYPMLSIGGVARRETVDA